jgi:chemotaxis signal transduction protein
VTPHPRHAPLGSAEALRRAFDESFAALPPAEAAERLALLRIGVAGGTYALRLSEISGLFVDRTITPVPGALQELIGIAGLRSGIVPIYDLGRLLGHETRAESGRWLVVTRDEPKVGFAFDEFRSYLQVPPDGISRTVGERAHLQDVVRDGETLIPILSLRSLAESLSERTRRLASLAAPERLP